MKNLIFLLLLLLVFACQEEKIVMDGPEEVDEQITENTNLKVSRRPDVLVIDPAWGGEWDVRIYSLSGNTNPPYQKISDCGRKFPFGLNANTEMDFSNCDMDNDGYYDQIGIHKYPGFRKCVTIFYKDGDNNPYSNNCINTGFPIPSNPEQFEYVCGDLDGNGVMDILQIQKFSDHIIVKGLSGTDYFGLKYRTYLSPEFQTGIRINIPNANNSYIWEYHCAKGTGQRDNLMLIHKNYTPSGKTEVLIYYSQASFQYHDRIVTGLHQAFDQFFFRFGNYDFKKTSYPDLYAFKRTKTGSGKFEVHVFKGTYFISDPKNYKEHIVAVSTPFTELPANWVAFLR